MAVKNFQTMTPDSLKELMGGVEMIPGTGRPSHLIDPRKKDKNWILATVKSIYNDFNKYSPYLFYNNRLEYNEIVNFIQGMQNPMKYQELYDQNISHNTNLTSVVYDKRILELLSKYFRLLKGKLSDVELQVKVKPNNGLARDHEDEYRGILQAFMQLNKILEENKVAQIEDFIGQAGFQIPDSNEELEIQMQTSKPEVMALYIKRGLDEVNRLDNLEQKFVESDYNLIAFGATAIETIPNQNGCPTREAIDPRNLLSGFSLTEDGRDLSEVGKFRMSTITQIMEEDRDKCLSTDDLKDIERHCLGKYGNDFVSRDRYVFGRQDELYGKYRCQLLDVYFYSYDEEVKVAKPNKNGNLRLQPKPFGYYKGREKEYEATYPNKRIYRTCNQNIYKATWIVGTDYIYNYGLFRDSEFVDNDIFRRALPIRIIAPLIKNGRTVSIIKEMIPIVEFANKMWKKMEEAVAHARPPGFEWDVNAVMAAVTSLSDQGYTFEKAFEMMVKDNIIVRDNKAMGGVANGSSPFEERYGGLGPDFGQWYGGLQYCIQLLQEISGFSNVAASSPAPYTGKKVAELASLSADYSIKHLFEAKRKIYENVMQSTGSLLMDSIRLGDCEALKNYFGENAYNFIKENVTKYQYSINIEFGPTQAEWNQVTMAAEKAVTVPLQDGGISYADYLRVVNSNSIEEAEQLLRLLGIVNKRNYQKEQIKMLQANGEEQRKSAEATSQAQQQQLALQLQHEQQLVAMKTQADMDLKRTEFLYKMEELKLTGLIKGDHISTQGDIDKEITEIQAKYNLDRMKGKVPGGEKAKK